LSEVSLCYFIRLITASSWIRSDKLIGGTTNVLKDVFSVLAWRIPRVVPMVNMAIWFRNPLGIVSEFASSLNISAHASCCILK